MQLSRKVDFIIFVEYKKNTWNICREARIYKMYFPFHKSVYPLEKIWFLIPFFNRFWKHLTIKWQALRLKGPHQLNYSMDNFGSNVNVIMCIKIFKIGLFLCCIGMNYLPKNETKHFTTICAYYKCGAIHNQSLWARGWPNVNVTTKLM